MKTYEEYKDKLIAIAKRFDVGYNIDNPVTIQDKINWLKIYDSTPLKTKCADKIKLHDYCKEKLGTDLCIPILKVYDRIEDIDWGELPNQFVMKCNHGSGMNIVVKDKSKLDIEEAKRKLKKFMGDDFAFHVAFEMHYHDIPHKIFVEEYKADESQTESLFDYKFWCFNGEPKFYTVNAGFGHGDILYYWMDGTSFNPYMVDETNPENHFEKPVNFDEMVDYARKLSSDFKFVRVDFYEVGGFVYLGELTFTPGAGLFVYKDKKYDKLIGDLLSL